MREISSCIHTKNARWRTWDTAVNKIQTAILIQWGKEMQEQSDECHSKGDRGTAHPGLKGQETLPREASKRSPEGRGGIMAKE